MGHSGVRGESMKKCINGKYIDMTEDEISAMKAEATRAQLEERSRPLSGEEVYRLVISETINSVALDDNTALRAMEFYPQWKPGAAYAAGYKVQRNGKLWRAVQAHTSQTGWEPGAVGTESLWEQVNETHAGTQEDPIPYDGNMELMAGMYYCQDYVIYKCIRATGQPVYHALAELAGIYVEAV